MTLKNIPCNTLAGVGPKMCERLEKLHLHSAQDILFHLPMRYEDRTQITPFYQLRTGEHVVIEGVVESAEKPFRGRTKLLCAISDGQRLVHLRFLHVFPLMIRQFSKGTRVRCYGEVRWGMLGFEIIHPEYEILMNGQGSVLAQSLTPIYSTTEGLSQAMWRKLTDQALSFLNQDLEELLPESLLKEHQLMDLKMALQYVHRPPPDADKFLLQAGSHPAQQRLAFEELLANRLKLLTMRLNMKKYSAKVLVTSSLRDCLLSSSTASEGRVIGDLEKKTEFQSKLGVTLVQGFLSSLKFKLTNAQQRVISEIDEDLSKPSPMMRLVQGDVGSGKTIVAAMAMLRAVENKTQSAMLAPTELLALQHYKNVSAWFEPLGIKVVCLTGQVKGKARKEILSAIENGDASIIVGTHAIFQEAVIFKSLVLVVVDEQHRFGVEQRLLLTDKGRFGDVKPHQLIMSATPIPRTLAMSAYADLDVSIIDELPPGRTPVKTVAIANTRRDEVVSRVKEICAQGRQAYWVCTLITESETLECQTAEKTFELLQAQLPTLKAGLVHGQLKPSVKQSVMEQFKQGELDLLVSTTVIEVGVDVPNASLMIIENPERMGLAQLHQLRGRVGRGSAESFCVLLYQNPLSKMGNERIQTLRETQDGFKVAEKDLELRGPGELLGTRQTGLIMMAVADLIRDRELLPSVQKAADILLSGDPQRVEALMDRWLKQSAEYAGV